MNGVIGVKEQLLLSRIGDSAAAELVMTILTTARRIDAECAALLAEHGLSEARFAALLAISKEPHTAPRSLAKHLGVTSATVTGLLDGLSRDGLIRRAPHKTDRRMHTLVCTPKGKQLLAELEPLYTGWFSQIAAGLSPAALQDTTKTLMRIQANLQTQEKQ